MVINAHSQEMRDLFRKTEEPRMKFNYQTITIGVVNKNNILQQLDVSHPDSQSKIGNFCEKALSKFTKHNTEIQVPAGQINSSSNNDNSNEPDIIIEAIKLQDNKNYIMIADPSNY